MSAFQQFIDACVEHEGCVTVTCMGDRGVEWVSHILLDGLPDGVTVEACVNASYPVTDRRVP